MKVLPARCDPVRSAGDFVGEQRQQTEWQVGCVSETERAANRMAGGVRRRPGGREVAGEWMPRTGRESSTRGMVEILTEGLKIEKRPPGERGIEDRNVSNLSPNCFSLFVFLICFLLIICFQSSAELFHAFAS